MLNSIFLAISSSIDSLGIGITYGLQNTKISFIGKIILFSISIVTAYLSIFLGNIIQSIFPMFLTKFIGCIILIAMGIYISLQAFKTKEKSSNIFNNPISSDLDHSNCIDSKEAIFLAIALSLDSLCIGIGGSVSNMNLILFPLFVSVSQLLFLNVGDFLGNRVNNFCKIPQNVWSILSGILLIFIGVVKLFIS